MKFSALCMFLAFCWFLSPSFPLSSSSLSAHPPFISPPPFFSLLLPLYSDPSPHCMFFMAPLSLRLPLYPHVTLSLFIFWLNFSSLCLSLSFCLSHFVCDFKSFHFLSPPSQPPLTVHFPISFFLFLSLLYFCLNFPFPLPLSSTFVPSRHHLPLPLSSFSSLSAGRNKISETGRNRKRF